MNQWRLLREEHERPDWALAIEEAIPRTVGQRLAPDTLRLWRTENSIIIGRFQCPKLEAALSSCLRHKISIVRRFTGGGAVYHDMGNLNFALSIHNDSWSINKLSDFYKNVGQTVVKGLNYLGMSAKYTKRSIYVSDRKISGLAGMTTKEVVFVHGSLLVDSNLEILYQVLNLEKDRPRKRFVSSAVKKVTTLKDELNRKIQMSEVEEALVEAFEENFESSLVLRELTKGERELARTLFKDRYSRLQWILATCEGCSEREKDASILETLTSLWKMKLDRNLENSRYRVRMI